MTSDSSSRVVQRTPSSWVTHRSCWPTRSFPLRSGPLTQLALAVMAASLPWCACSKELIAVVAGKMYTLGHSPKEKPFGHGHVTLSLSAPRPPLLTKRETLLKYESFRGDDLAHERTDERSRAGEGDERARRSIDPERDLIFARNDSESDHHVPKGKSRPVLAPRVGVFPCFRTSLHANKWGRG